MHLRVLTILSLILSLGLPTSVSAETGSGRPAKSISRTYGFSGTLADLGLYYSLTEATATPAANNTWQSDTSIYDFKLGYIMENQVYLGALYSGRRDNQIAPDHENGAAMGAGIGYFGYNGFNVRAFYKFNDTYGEYEEGTGYQVDLGYAINPTSSLYLGLNLSVRETNFRKNDAVAGFQGWSRKESYPFVTVGFLFF